MADTTTPLVSFIITGCNEERYIAESIKSAVNQDYENMEIVISDNCSDDGTYGIMLELQAMYLSRRKIKVVQTKKRTLLTGNLKNAYNNCSGDIIVRGCGDDIHKPHRVSATVAAFNENPGTHILCGCWDLINEDGSPSIKTHKVIFENHLLTNSFTQYNQLQCFLISKQFGGYWGVTAAYRRSVFTQFDELPDDIIHDDTLMSFRGLLLGKGLWLKDYLVDYRRRSGQVTDGGGGDLYHREKKMALSSKNDLVMTVCYGKDLSRFVSQATSELDYKGIVAMINNEAMWRDLHANWWDYSYVKRLAIFYKLIFSRDRVPRDFMARRILPYALFPLNNMVVNSAITLKRGLGL